MRNHSTITSQSEVRPLRPKTTTGTRAGVTTLASLLESWRVTMNPSEYHAAVGAAGRVLDREREDLAVNRFIRRRMAELERAA